MRGTIGPQLVLRLLNNARVRRTLISLNGLVEWTDTAFLIIRFQFSGVCRYPKDPDTTVCTELRAKFDPQRNGTAMLV
jgi:hypothetical protein